MRIGIIALAVIFLASGIRYLREALHLESIKNHPQHPQHPQIHQHPQNPNHAQESESSSDLSYFVEENKLPVDRRKLAYGLFMFLLAVLIVIYYIVTVIVPITVQH